MFGAKLESNDAFCASCHVEPETAYYQASIKPGPPGTLAVLHAQDQTRCIDCHSRPWFTGRLIAQIGGLMNLAAYATGRYRDPAVTTRPVGDSGCSKCHRDLSWVRDRPGHYHSPWLRRRWQSEGGPLNTCEACHPSHQAAGPADTQFMNRERIEDHCERCHERIR